MKKNKLLLLTVFLILATGAMASATNMPWEVPLDKLLKSLTGPVARTVSNFSFSRNWRNFSLWRNSFSN